MHMCCQALEDDPCASKVCHSLVRRHVEKADNVLILRETGESQDILTDGFGLVRVLRQE